MNEFFAKLSKSRHFKFGVPFLLLIVAGSVGLRQFTSNRYEFRKTELINADEVGKYGIKMKKKGEVTLETEYEKIKKIDIDNWVNIRGPRLWDETPNDEE